MRCDVYLVENFWVKNAPFFNFKKSTVLRHYTRLFLRHLAAALNRVGQTPKKSRKQQCLRDLRFLCRPTAFRVKVFLQGCSKGQNPLKIGSFRRKALDSLLETYPCPRRHSHVFAREDCRRRTFRRQASENTA